MQEIQILSSLRTSRPDSASTQSHQCLCYSLSGKNNSSLAIRKVSIFKVVSIDEEAESQTMKTEIFLNPNMYPI